MLKRVAAFWFGLICTYCGIDILVHGFRGGWSYRNPAGAQITAVIIALFGAYLLIFGISPKLAKAILSIVYKRKDV
jgi:hypothetical protein